MFCYDSVTCVWKDHGNNIQIPFFHTPFEHISFQVLNLQTPGQIQSTKHFQFDP